MRVAIVNDMALAVEVLHRVVRSAPGYDIAWIARDGAEAVQRCSQDRPDIILMDMIMPVMDGVDATRLIMKQSPCAILVVTATVEGNLGKVFEAMGCGALDVVATPVLGRTGQVEGGAALLHKIEVVSRLLKPRGSEPAPTFTQHPADHATGPSSAPPLVLLGASTGGPQAIAQVLEELPSNLNAPVLVVQHVDVTFADGLSRWLDNRCKLPVETAKTGVWPQPGRVLLAASNDHLVCTPERRLIYTPHPQSTPYRPSVDALFESLAAHWPTPSVAVLLTGMGRDGARGMALLRQRHWLTIAQDQQTSVVFGMPRAAIELGAASKVLPLSRIAPAIIDHIQSLERARIHDSNRAH